MKSLRLVAALVGALVLSFVACGPGAVEPELGMRASPRTIDNRGQESTITITATDPQGKPGTGSVTVTSVAGSLAAGQDVQLNAGTAEVPFSCVAATDSKCTGSVRINATWTTGGKTATAATTVTVAAPDAGSPGDGGMTMDAGMRVDGGVFDGGMSGAYRVDVVSNDKVVLLEGTPDRATIVFKVSTNTQNPLPIEATPLTVTVNDGSLSASADLKTVTVMTAADGTAMVNVYVRDAVLGTFIDVQGAALDASNTTRLKVVKVQTIAPKSDPLTQTVLTIRSTGSGFSTPLFFEVKDSNNMPVPNVDVDFAVAPNSAAGCTVAPPRDRSNSMGLVRTTLTSGDSQGTATVVATVLGLSPVNSNPISIVIGRASDERLSVTCARKSIGALQPSTPPQGISITCRADFADRNGVRPPFALNVSWWTEAGGVSSSSTAMPNSGFATNMFSTPGNMPVATTPLPGEPTNGANNPRDNFVTITAAVPGEEQFWDGSGSSNGVTNGKWDPGEWFVDLPEPFADSNDNGRRDPGEPFGDTDRVNCATGQVEPKNGQWDGPNGCWDANTQIWRSTHVVYTGSLVDNPSPTFIEFTPAIPTLVGAMAVQTVEFNWYDAYFNRLSVDSPTMTVATISGTRGTVAVTPRLAGESVGHDLQYLAVSATESAPGSGVFTENGPCDFMEPDAGYPLTRCIRTYKFGPWRTVPSGGRLTFTGASPQQPLMDGGIPAPTTSVFELRAINQFQAGPSVFPFQVQFQ